MDDLKLLYRAYVTDSLSGGRLEENKVNEYCNIFCNVFWSYIYQFKLIVLFDKS